ncbi:CLUMA_CG014829, isoform A [Clunio marinus]|uniref:CLUMA_CG014829, isoform A n=1 Tax=Clunio marinus TaxID=568069 RepID=A0A1J1ILI0_9DIPT|nr:CLUMA_CG014829, isoform A [Clunio marinus]
MARKSLLLLAAVAIAAITFQQGEFVITNVKKYVNNEKEERRARSREIESFEKEKNVKKSTIT